eukprot:1162029-Pelagomonas_calceolata.AAC.4
MNGSGWYARQKCNAQYRKEHLPWLEIWIVLQISPPLMEALLYQCAYHFPSLFLQNALTKNLGYALSVEQVALLFSTRPQPCLHT